jgi:hypothetical protein
MMESDRMVRLGSDFRPRHEPDQKGPRIRFRCALSVIKAGRAATSMV